MASDYLLELDGVKGESSDAKHKDAIEIESFSWGLSNPGSAASGGGGGAGKVSFRDIHFATQTSTASPSLFLACASGMHIKKATLFVRKSGDDRGVDYYQVKLTDLLVTSYQSGGTDGDGEGGAPVPTDQFSLNFAKIEFSVSAQGADGVQLPPSRAGWDLKKNTKV